VLHLLPSKNIGKEKKSDSNPAGENINAAVGFLSKKIEDRRADPEKYKMYCELAEIKGALTLPPPITGRGPRRTRQEKSDGREEGSL